MADDDLPPLAHGRTLTVEELNADLRQVAALPLPRARTVQPQAYLSDAYFAYEARAVMAAGWVCVAHVSQVRTPGSYLALDVLDEPILVLRDRAGGINVLSRVCPHRAADIMPPVLGFGAGEVKSLVCPYHRWAFDFDGSLKGCPEMHRADAFDRSEWRLAAIRSAVWQGFVFVNLDGAAPALEGQFAGFASLVAPWRMDELELVIAMDWECPFNWKVMAENWMESYHHLGIHHGTLNQAMPAAMTWSDPEQPHFIRAHLPLAPHLAEEVRAADASGTAPPGFLPIPGLPLADRQEWGLYLGHPFFMLLTAPDRVIWYRLVPVSATRCRLTTTTLVTKAAREHPDFDALLASETAMLRDFHTEDMQVNVAVQAGLRSRHAVRGRLSHLEEPIWLIQRYLAARSQGRYPGAGSA